MTRELTGDLTIDVFADVVCPWCYLGEARLERAVAQKRTRNPELRVTWRWHPFQLRPEMPARGLSWRAFAEEKFGGWAQAQRMFAQVSELGAQAGLAFNFDRVASAPNTANAHRLILWAETWGQAQTVAHALFRAYFAEGYDLSSAEQLVRVADGVGLSAREARRFLESGEGADEVRESQLRAQRLGVGSVPCYVFNEIYAVSGAQSVEVFGQALDLAAQGAESGEEEGVRR